MKILKYWSLLLIAMVAISCGEEEIPVADNAQQIQEYIAANNLDAVEVGDTGLFVVIAQEGNGEFPTLNDNVTVHYHGTFLDGSVFDSSVLRGEPATFPLTGVILGWQIGIPQFSKGGTGTLLIPNNLAYGPAGTGGIPGNSVLIFDVELIDF